MKSKLIFMIAGAAVVTLSFTFVSTSRKSEVKPITEKKTFNEPAGGFISEDKL